MWKTPLFYSAFPGGKDLPKKLKVWRVQNLKEDFQTQPPFIDEAFDGYGIVLAPEHFAKDADAENLVQGYNTTKGNNSVAVGRYKNYLHWGFSAVPSKMNEAGINLFLNSIVYISKFSGKKN